MTPCVIAWPAPLALKILGLPPIAAHQLDQVDPLSSLNTIHTRLMYTNVGEAQ
jgi:hypothetical protein